MYHLLKIPAQMNNLRETFQYKELLGINEKSLCLLRDFPDHATFREKGAKLACADKLGVFLSLK